MTSLTTRMTLALADSILVASCSSVASPTGLVATDMTVPTQGAISNSTGESLGQAIIPIPPGVDYRGISAISHDEYAEISFFAGNGVYPTASGATSYGALLGEAGWTRCVGEPGCETANVTDTAFLGVFRHGVSMESPTIVIGINQMISPDEWTILFVKNCRTIEEVRGDYNSDADCVIALPVEPNTPSVNR